MEWALCIAAAVVLVVCLRVVLRYVAGKIAVARAAYNLELDRDVLRQVRVHIEKARGDRQPHG